MPIYSIHIFRKRDNGDPILLASETDLSQFSFFQRSSILGFITTIAELAVKNCETGTCTQVTENKYVLYTRVFTNNLAGVVCTDDTYPTRVALGCISEIINSFSNYSGGDHENNTPSLAQYPKLSEILQKYSDPYQADRLLQVRQEIDATVSIMQKCVTDILNRGEKLDEIVDKSNYMSEQSKKFYKASKRNKCCISA